MATAAFQGQGIDHYVDQLEQPELDFLAAQAEIARLDPADPRILALVQVALDAIGTVQSLREDVQREGRALRAWGRGQLSGVIALFPNAKREYAAQIEDSAQRYDELADMLGEPVAEWLAWIDEVLPPAEPTVQNGMMVCTSGHENHITRSHCVICGENF